VLLTPVAVVLSPKAEPPLAAVEKLPIAWEPDA
jgi:hypothetical protein